jgi:adenylate cyclase
MFAAVRRRRRPSRGARAVSPTCWRAPRSTDGRQALSISRAGPGSAANRRSRDLKLVGLALAVMLAFVTLQLVALDVRWLRRLELIALDAQMRVRGARAPGPETVIVMIDDASLADLGRWPVPRRRLAELVTMLHRAGARTIGIDVLFADPEHGSGDAADDGDAALAAAMREAPDVVLPFAFRFGGETLAAGVRPASYAQTRTTPGYRPLALAPTGLVTPQPVLADAATLGHMLVAYDVDGAPRYEYPALEFDLDLYPSMAVRIAQHYLDVPWAAVTATLGRGVALGAIDVPTDPAMRIVVNYLGPSPAFPTFGLSQVLQGAVPPATFRDRIVLIGSNALGTRDTFQSPFTAVMPGVERLATVVDSMLHRHHVQRPAAIALYEAASLLVAAAALGMAVSRWPLAIASLCAAAFVALVGVAAQVALARYGIWQQSAIAIVAIIVTFISLSLYRYGLLDKERRHIRSVFQRYLAPEMVERVVDSPTLPELGGELRELTVLFCDLRGFTTLSERLDPATLTRVVNAFLQVATDAVLEHGGTVDKYVGDAIMAFWNAPADQPDHAQLACRAALRIRERLEALNATAGAGTPRLEAGVGINTGLCTVGNFGSRHRFDYSALGDPVNVAARLEGETKSLGAPILLGPRTAALATGFITRPVGNVQLRGRVQALDGHALVAVADAPSQ